MLCIGAARVNISALRLLSAGLDYVSCTAKTGLPAERLVDLGRAIVRDEQAAGNELAGSDWKGYRLERAGQASVGVRGEDALVTVSGAAAFLYGHALLQLAGHASRTDLQITMHSAEWKVRELIWRARYRPDASAQTGRPIERHYVDNSRLGATCYLGSAKSDQRGRFYDKHAESPEEYAEGTARLEVQYRKRAADAVREECSGDRLDSARITGTVAKWFQTRGVLTDVNLPTAGAITPPRPDATDYERHRLWLRECVAPAIRRFSTMAGPGDLAADLAVDLGSLLGGRSPNHTGDLPGP